MRFLVDECTGPAVAQWLRRQNHDVISVFDEIRGAGAFTVEDLTTTPISHD